MKIEHLQTYLKEQNIDAFLIESPINRRYVSGFTGSFGTVLLTQNDAVFITDFRYTSQANEQAIGYEVIENRNTTEEVQQQMAKRKLKTLAFEEDHTSFKKYKALAENPSIELVPVANIIEKMREIKSADEIEKIKTAAHIADLAFEKILKDIQVGVSEREICNKLEMYMRAEGAISSSFDIIIASGHRSALPHGVASTKLIDAGDFVTMDFGALYEGYCSDITRTVVVGEEDAKLKEIYSIVNDALTLGIDSVKAGVSCSEVDTKIRDYITDKGYGEQFGHGAGHSFGLEIHESPYFSKTSDEVLEENMAMTIEPGIYIPGLGGVRIEDDVIVTKDGCEVITKSPKHLIKI